MLDVSASEGHHLAVLGGAGQRMTPPPGRGRAGTRRRAPMSTPVVAAEDDEDPRQRIALRPGWRVHRPSIIVAVVLVALAVASTLVTRNLVHNQEHQLLKERAAEVGLVL